MIHMFDAITRKRADGARIARIREIIATQGPRSDLEATNDAAAIDLTDAPRARNLADERAEVSASNSGQDPHALLTVRPSTVGVSITRNF